MPIKIEKQKMETIRIRLLNTNVRRIESILEVKNNEGSENYNISDVINTMVAEKLDEYDNANSF